MSTFYVCRLLQILASVNSQFWWNNVASDISRHSWRQNVDPSKSEFHMLFKSYKIKLQSESRRATPSPLSDNIIHII